MKRNTSDFKVTVTEHHTIQVPNVQVIDRACELLLGLAGVPRNTYVNDSGVLVYRCDRGYLRELADQSNEKKRLVKLEHELNKLRHKFL